MRLCTIVLYLMYRYAVCMRRCYLYSPLPQLLPPPVQDASTKEVLVELAYLKSYESMGKAEVGF